jgi:hypothetical protein
MTTLDLLLSLPLELLIRVLSHLRIRDLLSCRQLNRSFSVLIDETPQLQYQLALDAASLEDNPNSDLNSLQRHERLKKREAAWNNFEIRSRTLLPFSGPAGIFEHAGGVYIKGEHAINPNNLTPSRIQSAKMIHLPSSDRIPSLQELKWTPISVDAGLGIVHSKICRENDLVVVITWLDFVNFWLGYL